MAKFGLGKSVPNQGGVAKAHTAPSRVTSSNGSEAGTVKTPGMGPGNATNPIMHVPGKGGSGTKSAGGPKPFKG